MEKILFSIIIITCLFTRQAFASSAAGLVDKGNRLYNEQKYEDAIKLYDQALSKQPESAIIGFDAGTAQYKNNDYQKASSYFEKSLITEDKNLEAKANYNLGNSRYMLGLSKENTDLSGAVQLLEEALKNYNRTIELAPKDEDAKVNYKIVEKKLKELKEKLKQQPQENKNNQKQENQNQEKSQKQKEQNMQQTQQQQKEEKQKEENQAEQAKQEEKKSEEKKEESKQAQEQQEQKQAEQQKQGEQKTREQQTAVQPEESKEMSKDEANMLLEGYRQEENKAGMLRDDRKGVEEKVLKDW